MYAEWGLSHFKAARYEYGWIKFPISDEEKKWRAREDFEEGLDDSIEY